MLLLLLGSLILATLTCPHFNVLTRSSIWSRYLTWPGTVCLCIGAHCSALSAMSSTRKTQPPDWHTVFPHIWISTTRPPTTMMKLTMESMHIFRLILRRVCTDLHTEVVGTSHTLMLPQPHPSELIIRGCHFIKE